MKNTSITLPSATCSGAFNRTLRVAVIVLAVILSGCGSGHSTKNPGIGSASTSSGEATEEQAREKLTTVLDAWVFGDDKAKIERDHAKIKFVAHELDRVKLTKYELGVARKSGRVYEFAVVMIMKDKIGKETKETRTYVVSKKSADSEDENFSASLKKARAQEAKLFGDADWMIVQKAGQ